MKIYSPIRFRRIHRDSMPGLRRIGRRFCPGIQAASDRCSKRRSSLSSSSSFCVLPFESSIRAYCCKENTRIWPWSLRLIKKYTNLTLTSTVHSNFCCRTLERLFLGQILQRLVREKPTENVEEDDHQFKIAAIGFAILSLSRLILGSVYYYTLEGVGRKMRIGLTSMVHSKASFLIWEFG